MPDSDFAHVHVTWADTRANQFIAAARVPFTLQPQLFGLWSIERVQVDAANLAHAMMVGASTQTILRRISWTTLHLAQEGKASGEIVMEDSRVELAKHLPVWLAARGRVLNTGLGLGCVVRGLLSNPEVTHIDVVERDAGILRVVGAEFLGNPRVTMHFDDALKMRWPKGTRWDFAWHDIWSRADETHLTKVHASLLGKYRRQVGRQGAWELPRWFCRLARGDALRAGKPDWLLR